MADPTRLLACLADIERHVAGECVSPRLFALVSTAELQRRAAHLELPAGSPDSLTAVEQDLDLEGDLLEALGQVAWPAEVEGCAVALESSFVPPRYRADIPEDDAAAFVTKHPERIDARVVTGVMRDGTRQGIARLLDQPENLMGATDLVPGLAEALLTTFEETA